MDSETSYLPDMKALAARHPDRHPNGQLKPGARLGGGNPNAKRQQELKKALMNCASEEDIQGIYASMLLAAKTGDVQAAKVLLDHLIGRPSQSIEVSGPDGQSASINLSTVTATILAALGPDNEARYKVAAALRQINLTDGTKADEDRS